MIGAAPPADDIGDGREAIVAIRRTAPRPADANTPRVSIGMPGVERREVRSAGIGFAPWPDDGRFRADHFRQRVQRRDAGDLRGVRQAGQRIRYYRNERNIGLQGNFVRVLGLATAPYFMWGCHDDQWDPSYIAKMVDVLDQPRNLVVLAGSNSASIDQDGVVRRRYDNVPVYPAGDAPPPARIGSSALAPEAGTRRSSTD